MDVSAWPGLELMERVEEGNRNEVWRGTLDGAAVAVRRSRRSAVSLDWELDLIDRLDAAGFLVPVFITAATGERSVDGVVVQRWIEGHPPQATAEWHAVADQLQQLHTEFADHPQRPDCRTVTELDATSTSVDADMAALPDDVAERVLAVFAELADVPRSVIHGDAGASNLRIAPDGRVGLLDFDESRRDLTWHDLSELGVQVLPDVDHRRAKRLSHAWEAANAWVAEPDYARARLDQLDAFR